MKTLLIDVDATVETVLKDMCVRRIWRPLP